MGLCHMNQSDQMVSNVAFCFNLPLFPPSLVHSNLDLPG